MVRNIFKFLGICAILASAWYAFLFLVPKPPIDTTPVLIMVWSSVVILFLALFPNALDRVKRLKLKDFEIELQETVAKSTTEDFISLPDLDEYVFSQKGDFSDLRDILDQAARQPSKPILLVANLREGDYISIPMLFIYLFFLDFINTCSVSILFISSKRPLRSLKDISIDSIVGVISGKIVLQTLYKHFPRFTKIFDFQRFSDYSHEDFLYHGRLWKTPPESFFRHCYETIREMQTNHSEHLSEGDIVEWFKNRLNSRFVDVSLNPSDIKTIREALVEGDEFIISIKDRSLNSVISLCYLSKNISKKVLADFIELK